MGGPIQLASYDEEEGVLKLEQEALETLKTVAGPFRVLAATGETGTGKTILLNGVINAINADAKVFPRKITSGIWMALLPLPEGTIVLLDVEGFKPSDQKRTNLISAFIVQSANEIMLLQIKSINKHTVTFLEHVVNLNSSDSPQSGAGTNVCICVRSPEKTEGLEEHVPEQLKKVSEENEQSGIIESCLKDGRVRVLGIPVLGSPREKKTPLTNKAYKAVAEGISGVIRNSSVKTDQSPSKDPLMEGAALANEMEDYLQACVSPPVQADVLLTVNKKSKLELDGEALKMIKASPAPFRILAAVGDARIGKSTFLNALIRSIEGKGKGTTFSVGHSTDACTRGVWMKILPSDDGTLIILDVEGVNLGDDAVTTQLSLFTCLIACEVMLFGHQVLKNTAVNFLYHIAQLKDNYADEVDEAKLANICVVLRDPLKPKEGTSLRDYVAQGLTTPGIIKDNLDEQRRRIGNHVKAEDIQVLTIPTTHAQNPLQDEGYQNVVRSAKERVVTIKVRESMLENDMNGDDLAQAMQSLVQAIVSDDWESWYESCMDFEEQKCLNLKKAYMKPFLAVESIEELDQLLKETWDDFKEKCKFENYVTEAETEVAKRKQELEIYEEQKKKERSDEAYQRLIKPLLQEKIKSEDLEKRIPEALENFKEEGLPKVVEDAVLALENRLEAVCTKEQKEQERLTNAAYDEYIWPLLQSDMTSTDLENKIQTALQNYMDMCNDGSGRAKAEHDLQKQIKNVKISEAFAQEQKTKEAMEKHINPLLRDTSMSSTDFDEATEQAIKAFSKICPEEDRISGIREMLNNRKQQLLQKEEMDARNVEQENYDKYIDPLFNSSLPSEELIKQSTEALKVYKKVCKDEGGYKLVDGRLKAYIEAAQKKEEAAAREEEERRIRKKCKEVFDPILQGDQSKTSSVDLERMINQAKGIIEQEDLEVPPEYEIKLDQCLCTRRNEEKNLELEEKAKQEQREHEMQLEAQKQQHELDMKKVQADLESKRSQEKIQIEKIRQESEMEAQRRAQEQKDELQMKQIQADKEIRIQQLQAEERRRKDEQEMEEKRMEVERYKNRGLFSRLF